MLKIFIISSVVEKSIEIADKMRGFEADCTTNREILPRIDLKPISSVAVTSHEAPSVIFLASSLVVKDIEIVSEIVAVFPEVPLVVWEDEDVLSLSSRESIIRMGVTDFLSAPQSAINFFVLLIRINAQSIKKHGRLIVVDGAMGRCGVTTFVAAMGHALAEQQHDVTMVDTDYRRQSLARFLLIKPCTNDILTLICNHKRMPTSDVLELARSRVFEGHGLYCVAPPPPSDGIFTDHTGLSRTYRALMEYLNSVSETTIIDVSHAIGAVQRSFYALADELILLAEPTNTSIFGLIIKICDMQAAKSKNTEIRLVTTEVSREQLAIDDVRRLLAASPEIRNFEKIWTGVHLPFCKRAAAWPASGGTAYSFGSRDYVVQLDRVHRLIFGQEIEQLANIKEAGVATFTKRIKSLFAKKEIENKKSELKLLPPASTDTVAPDYPQEELREVVNGDMSSNSGAADLQNNLLTEKDERQSQRQHARVGKFVFKN